LRRAPAAPKEMLRHEASTMAINAFERGRWDFMCGL
jgi:hypothetical protein